MQKNMSRCIYDVECKDLAGAAVPFRHLQGRPILIVNTASLCGYSYQFKDLEAIWQRHKDAGLMVMAAPSNDFGHQEPGSSLEVMSMCTTKFGITFPLLEKMPVTGNSAHPLFQWLAEQGGYLSRPRWNFYKYIVGRDGHLQDWFSTLTNPTRHSFTRALDEVIGGTAPATSP